jgi:hypothetical protein
MVCSVLSLLTCPVLSLANLYSKWQVLWPLRISLLCLLPSDLLHHTPGDSSFSLTNCSDLIPTDHSVLSVVNHLSFKWHMLCPLLYVAACSVLFLVTQSVHNLSNWTILYVEIILCTAVEMEQISLAGRCYTWNIWGSNIVQINLLTMVTSTSITWSTLQNVIFVPKTTYTGSLWIIINLDPKKYIGHHSKSMVWRGGLHERRKRVTSTTFFRSWKSDKKVL